jgi:hypothetical protein
LQGVIALLPKKQFGVCAARPFHRRWLDGAGAWTRGQLADSFLAQRFFEEFRIAHIAVEIFCPVALASIAHAGMNNRAGGFCLANQLAININRRSA